VAAVERRVLRWGREGERVIQVEERQWPLGKESAIVGQRGGCFDRKVKVVVVQAKCGKVLSGMPLEVNSGGGTRLSSRRKRKIEKG